MKVLFVTTECVPYAKTGGLADVAGSLPKALRDEGLDVRILMPRYRGIDVAGMEEVVGGLPVPISSRTIYGKIFASETPAGVPIYLLDQPKYFDRRGLYTEDGVDYPDNAERFTFFSRAAIEFIKTKKFEPDLVHANDWFTGLVPVYLRTLYQKSVRRIPVVTTIHNLAYQGVFWHYDMHLTNLPWSLFRFDKLEFYGKINFLKGGLVYSDKLTTVSPRYAREICTPAFGCGLQNVLKKRERDLVGILNGVDYDIWNPATDRHLAANYDSDSLDGKRECKRDLQRLNNLPESDRPLFGIVSRVTEQKGFGLLIGAMKEMLALGAQFILLGNGDPRYEAELIAIAKEHPLSVGINLMYSDELAHKIEAGSDIFLMPSRFEPCGLNQLYSMKYGTVPLVHEVGGLADTVLPWKAETGEGRGFVFRDYTNDAFLEALRDALTVYKDSEAWTRLMRNGMAMDWSWKRSSRLYVDLYQEAVTAQSVAAP